MTSSSNEFSVTVLSGGFQSPAANKITPSGDSPYADLVGRKVCVQDGAIEGLTGIVVALRDPSRVVISVDADCPGCYVEIDGHSIAAIEP